VDEPVRRWLVGVVEHVDDGEMDVEEKDEEKDDDDDDDELKDDEDSRIDDEESEAGKTGGRFSTTLVRSSAE
jgi:hypothetical protein